MTRSLSPSFTREAEVRSFAAARLWPGPALIGIGAALAVGGGILGAAVSPVAGFAILVALGAGLMMLAEPRYGLLMAVGIIYILPFAVIPVPIGGVRLTFLDATLTVLLLTVLARILTHRQRSLIATPVAAPLLLFIGLAITAFFMGIESMTSETLRFFLKTINSLLFFLTVVNLVQDRKTLRRVVQALILAGAATAVVALLMYVLPKAAATQLLSGLRVVGYPSGPGVLRYIAGTSTLRAIGTSIDPNVLGGMLLIGLPVLASQFFAEARVLPRRLLLVVGLLQGAALVLTYSRSAWAGTAAAVLFLGLFQYRRAWLIPVVILLTVFVLPQGDLVIDRFQQGVTLQDKASQMRLGEYQDALHLISLYPWFGVGFGDAPNIDLYVAAASIYFMMAEEMGLVGLSAFLIAMITLFVWALRSRRQYQDPVLRAITIGALASLVGALSAGSFDHYFFNLDFPHTIALFWLIAGTLAAGTRLGLESEPAVTETGKSTSPPVPLSARGEGALLTRVERH